MHILNAAKALPLLEEETKRIDAALTTLLSQGASVPPERAKAFIETAFAAIDTMIFQHATARGKR